MNQPAPGAGRPRRLAEFVGQPEVVRELEVLLGGARARGELCDHLLVCGPAGLGKTTLAGIVAAELGSPLVTTSGPVFERPGEMASTLAALPERAVLFVDEVHRLPRSCEEVLYPAMEDFELDLTVGEGPRARSVRVPLRPFVLVGATTQEGALSAPLRDRFGAVLRLRPYPVGDLAEIVARAAGPLGVRLAPGAAEAVAARGRGTPRVALRWLRRVRDWAQGRGVATVGPDQVSEALAAFGVDALGVDHLGREILRAVCTRHGGGPVGLRTLAAELGEAERTLEETQEPYLIHLGLLRRTGRGRVATAAGWRHVGLEPPREAA